MIDLDHRASYQDYSFNKISVLPLIDDTPAELLLEALAQGGSGVTYKTCAEMEDSEDEYSKNGEATFTSWEKMMHPGSTPVPSKLTDALNSKVRYDVANMTAKEILDQLTYRGKSEERIPAFIDPSVSDRWNRVLTLYLGNDSGKEGTLRATFERLAVLTKTTMVEENGKLIFKAPDPDWAVKMFGPSLPETVKSALRQKVSQETIDYINKEKDITKVYDIFSKLTGLAVVDPTGLKLPRPNFHQYQVILSQTAAPNSPRPQPVYGLYEEVVSTKENDKNKNANTPQGPVTESIGALSPDTGKWIVTKLNCDYAKFNSEGLSFYKIKLPAYDLTVAELMLDVAAQTGTGIILKPVVDLMIESGAPYKMTIDAEAKSKNKPSVPYKNNAFVVMSWEKMMRPINADRKSVV